MFQSKWKVCFEWFLFISEIPELYRKLREACRNLREALSQPHVEDLEKENQRKNNVSNKINSLLLIPSSFAASPKPSGHGYMGLVVSEGPELYRKLRHVCRNLREASIRTTCWRPCKRTYLENKISMKLKSLFLLVSDCFLGPGAV